MFKTRRSARLYGTLSPLVLLALVLAQVVGTTQPAKAASNELFFSEYIEGSSNNKALEIYNGTAASIDLATNGYNIQMFFNGSTSAGLTIGLAGTIAPGDVFVLAHSSANTAILNQADQTNGAGWFNGDDAVVLRKGTTTVDVIGQSGFDPGTEWGNGLTSTADNTLRRKLSVTRGDANASDTFDPAIEWEGFALDTIDGLGSHAPAPPPPPPSMGACGDPATPISAVQGSGASTPLASAKVEVEGVVSGMFPQLAGIYLQEEPTDVDEDPATSEGIFVYLAGAFASETTGIDVGDTVRVAGSAGEYTTSGGSSQTQIADKPELLDCNLAGVTIEPAEIRFPLNGVTDLEAYEGMLVRFPQQLAIMEYFNYDRFGEMVLGFADDVDALAGRKRFYTPTSIVEPGAEAAELQQAYDLRQITLDDGNSGQNPKVLRHPNGDSFSLTNRFRGGDGVDNVTGVIDETFGLYRVQPTAPAGYSSLNQRVMAPEQVGGRFQVAAFNTLNYFLTPDYASRDPRDNACGPAQNMECRGWDADQSNELTRQRAKLLEAVLALDAEVLGLNELENTTGVEPLADIVSGLNEELGAGTYAYIDTGVIGTDAIKVGLIYKPGVVTPVGKFAVLDSTDDARFVDTRNRPSLAQTFEENATGARFTVVVNHFKSKGSGCGAGDDDPQQGNCNGTRTNAAEALVDWLATDPTNSGDPDFLIVGDLNSYDQESPIDEIKAGADDIVGTADDYVDVVENFQGEFAYSYVFDGQLGYLDYALAIKSMAAEVTGATEWHINADEPDVLDYDTSFKPDEQDALYEPNAFRTADHDPVIVGLNLVHEFTGFFAPVQNLPQSTEVKAGSAVPIKFSLDGDKGLDVIASGYPLSAPKETCGNDDSSDNGAPTASAGPIALLYDAATDTYTYVWKTDETWAGTCRQLVVKLNDGPEHRADFRFTK